MTPRIVALILSALASACAPTIADTAELDPSAATSSSKLAACKVGIYRKDENNFLVLTRSGDGFSYSFHDGEIGSVGKPDSRVSCRDGAVFVDNAEFWRSAWIVEIDTRFASGEISLAGRLIEPVGADGSTPLIVYAHGSENKGWIEHYRDPYQMVGRGISVFVYDKRGTGRSEGHYTQNFPRLANDLVAASNEAKRLAGDRFGRFGIVGLSQGGWIAPLAADRAQADFIGIGYGLVTDIREEDAAQVQKELRDAGYGEDVLNAAREITDITARIASSEYTDGLDELNAIQQRYSGEEWFNRIRGGYTGVFLGMSSDNLREHGVPQFNNLEIDWSLNPMTVLRDVDLPQLWALAGEDREAPIDLTLERLSILREEGKDITIYTFPDTDHGMWEYEQKADGSRDYTRVTPGFYDLIADWAKGSVSDGYGRASKVRE